MRIGIDIRALMEGKTTGVQVYIVNLLHALFKIDQTNQYLLFANSWSDVSGRVKQFNYPNVRYRIYRFPNKLLIFFQKFLNFPKIDRLLGGVDLFFSPHWRVLALSKNIPLVLTFHDLSFEVVPEFFTPWQRFWHAFMNYRAAALRAAKIVAVSLSTKSDLVNLYHVAEDKISVIPSGVAFGEKAEKPPGLPEKYFLFFGTFEPRKNLRAVLLAYREYRQKSDNPMYLVLGGSRGWKTQIHLDPEIGKSVIIIQNLTEGQKAYMYRHAYAFLFLSFYEGFGFPILEAASQGRPVIVSYATSLLEIGRDFALFVNPFRPSQTAQAMLALEQDMSLYKRLSAAGTKTAVGYTWERAARETLKIFSEVRI